MPTPPRPPPPPRAGIEARKTPRYDIRLSAELTLEGGRTVTQSTRNLSEGGVCLQGNQVFPDGSRIRIGLFLVLDGIEDASEPPLEVTGVVSWSVPADGGEPGSMGIRFEALAEAAQARLAKFLRALPAT